MEGSKIIYLIGLRLVWRGLKTNYLIGSRAEGEGSKN